MEKIKEKFEECKKQVIEQNTFKANRIPRTTKIEIEEWASKEFCSDHGMAIKWLWDYYKGTLPSESEEVRELSVRLDLMADELGNMKNLVLENRKEKVVNVVNMRAQPLEKEEKKNE